jgi:tetratricopeptide (TPR) repeat protein
LNTEKFKKYTDKFLHLCLLSAVFLPQLVFYLPANDIFEAPKTAVFFFSVILCLAIFIYRQSLAGSFTLSWTPLSIPIFAFVLISLFSFIKAVTAAPSSFPVYWQSFKFTLISCIFYLLMINVFTKKDILKVLCVLLAAHFMIVTYGIFQYFGVDPISWPSFGEGRVFSTLGNPDYMAAQLSILVPLMITLLLSPLGRPAKFILSLYLAFMFFLITVSGGRGAWLSMAGSLAYLFAVLIFIYKKELFRAHKIPVITVAALLVFFGAVFSFSTPLNTHGQDAISRLKNGFSLTNDDAAVRLLYWESAVRMAAGNPVLGAGPGGFSLKTVSYQKKAYDRWLKTYPNMAAMVEPHEELFAHNDFLQTLAEEGFAGCGIFIWFILSALLMPLLLSFKEKDPLIKSLLPGISGAFAAYALNGFFNFPWRVSATAVLLWSVMGIFSLAENKKTVRLNTGHFQPAAAFISLILAFIAAAQFTPIYTGSCIRAGRGASAAGKYEQAISYFDSALASHPRGSDMIKLYLYGGSARSSLGQNAKALEYYNRGLKISPDLIEMRYNMANIYKNENDYASAIKEYSSVLALDPKFSAAWNNMGSIYFDQNNLEKSRDIYTQAVLSNPAGVEAHFNLGAVYFRLKQYKPAYQEFLKALGYNPDFEPAKTAAAKMRETGLGQ